MMKKLLLVFLSVLLGNTFTLKAQQKEEDKTLSPYFLVKSKDKSTDQMPLKHTAAEVNIAGVIADVKVSQVYVNEGKNTLEAIYVFPGSTRAAVYAMTMTIGERKLIAKIEEKNKARQQYEEAKEQGKTASLLEQQNPNVFQMNVANILPGDSITVELRYTELLEPTEGTYEFAYPTVVGPRYSETLTASATPQEKWVENPYLQAGEAPNYTFDIRTTLNAGMPIQKVASTSHQVGVKYLDKNTASIRLEAAEKFGGNRDYILKYQLAGGKIESGLLLYEGENAVAMGNEDLGQMQADEKFFLLMMQPPKAPKLDQIPPREYVFIVDVSGSMRGFPLDVSKSVLKELIAGLRPTDRFNVMLFESSSQMMSEESLTATPENIKKAFQVIDQQRGGGGTRLLPALKNALAFKETKDFSRSFVVVTDGYVTVEREAFDLIRNSLNQANLFAFGIGSSVNRYLIEGMARAGMGEPFIVTQESEAKSVGERFRRYVQTPVLTNIQLDYGTFQAYDVEPLSIPDVFAERPIIVYGKYKGQPQGKITLKGLSGKQTYTQSVFVNQANRENNQALRYLWARKRIQTLDDYTNLAYNNDKQKIQAEVTKLGLKYNLLTQYTSFIAIDPEARNKEGDQTTVKQPLPLPQGVPNTAVGLKKSSTLMNMNRRQRTTAGGTFNNASVGEVAVQEEISLELDVMTNQPLAPPPPPKQEKEEEIFTIVEQPAEYPGGLLAFYQYIRENMQYPAKAKHAGVEGKVLLQFVVNPDGSVSDIKVLKGLGYGCDEEAIRLLKNAQPWKPAKQQSRLVKSKMSITIQFQLK